MDRIAIPVWTTWRALHWAWRRVRANKGGAGADGVDLAQFEARLTGELGALQAMLRGGRYRPRGLLRVPRAKPDGGVRWLRIPAVRDRVIQTACTVALDRVLEPQMSAASFAYRRGRSVEAAAGRVTELGLQGWTWGVRFDIEAYFDRIPHRPLLASLEPAVHTDTLAVINSWLLGFGREIGVAQGSPISPLLANWYLTSFDFELNRGRTRLIRYADDILILSRSAIQAERARTRAETVLMSLGLRANPAKTQISPIAKGIDFLGLRFTNQSVTRKTASLSGGHAGHCKSNK